INGDHVTLGAYQELQVGNTVIDGYVVLGTNPASQGNIRLPNNQYIFWRNALNNGDVQGIGVDNLNRVKLGVNNTDIVYAPGMLVVDGYIAHDGTGSNVATIGFVRDQNNTTIVAFRDSTNTTNIAALSSNSNNNVVIG